MKKKKAEREKEELENIKKERNQLYQELMEMKKAERESKDQKILKKKEINFIKNLNKNLRNQLDNSKKKKKILFVV